MSADLRVTYVGHATTLIELDGIRILTDPWLTPRLGPLRRHGPQPDPEGLGPVDAVLISHAHPDHFHPASLARLGGDPLVIVPRGLGSATERSARRVHEVAVNERIRVGTVVVTAVPARHRRATGHRAARPIGYLLEGSRGVYFAGDTAAFPGMAGLAGRVDVALLPVGRWGPPIGPDRLSPRTAVDAARLLGARVAVPIHWGTLHVPGFGGGRWGWGSFGAGADFEAEGALHGDGLRIVVLRPGEGAAIDL